ncbi:MAG: hypothetical protein U5M51_13435 [Emticicia sp.]|nr:hypothetical protein [Emticicia sp.]
MKEHYSSINFNCTDPDGCYEKVFGNRRYDIADLKRDPKVAIEVKAYETGKVYLSATHIGQEVANNIINANKGLKIKWVLKDVCQIVN